MNRLSFFLLVVCLVLLSCSEDKKMTVVCLPVYGQSLALGEEAELITDFDSLAMLCDGRIVTERLDHDYGYFDPNSRKQWMKRLIGYKKHSYELSVYGMAERLVFQLGDDTLLCIFPGGCGGTRIADLSKGSGPYKRFLEDITQACQKSRDKGWEFCVPAVCWMQGETDLRDYTHIDYKQVLRQFALDVNADIHQITGQTTPVRLICYQSNIVSLADSFVCDTFFCQETKVPQAQMELVRDDTLFWASGPTYPYSFSREYIHLDGVSQKRFGNLAALSALNIIRGGERRQGLVPVMAKAKEDKVWITFHVPCSPLCLDTVAVANPGNYGFSVITSSHHNIAKGVSLQGDTVIIECSEPTKDCRVRYAINGERLKSGWRKGSRGNLRDSQGNGQTATICGTVFPLHNWCYQFDMPVE